MTTISAIQAHVAASFGIPVREMVSERQYRGVARPRQVAMYLSRELTPHSYPRIGFLFGGRDHTTIMAGCRRIEALIETDAEFAARVAAIRSELETPLEVL